jgi:TatD DNase family protein
VETDSPYLAPIPRRGRPNRPANVAHTLRFVAELRGVSEAEFDALTTANAARVFGW